MVTQISSPETIQTGKEIEERFSKYCEAAVIENRGYMAFPNRRFDSSFNRVVRYEREAQILRCQKSLIGIMKEVLGLEV